MANILADLYEGKLNPKSRCYYCNAKFKAEVQLFTKAAKSMGDILSAGDISILNDLINAHNAFI